jgi:hypothetical protein
MRISSIAWYATVARTANIPIKIYLKDTASTTLTSVTWATMITGATLVYSSTNASITASAWNNFTLSSTYDYSNGDNLIVMVEANYAGGGYGGSAGTGVRYTSATGCHEYWQQDNSAPTGSGTVTANRPNSQITYTIWSASVPPNPATGPSPADASTGQSKTTTLSWTSGGGGPTDYDVYFGTGASPAYIGNQATTTYNPGTLTYGTTYYWKIVPHNANGYATGCPTWSFTVMPDPTITTFPTSEGFEGTSFPPAGWVNTLVSGATGWQKVASSSSPTTIPHGGSNMLFYNSYSMSSPSNAWIATPPINCSGSTYNYRVGFWMWRDNTNYLTSYDLVNVYANTTQDLSGTPTLLGTVNRIRTAAPVETGADGWYYYVFDIGSGSKSTKYVLFQAVAQDGNNMTIDDITILREDLLSPPNACINPSPADAASGLTRSVTLSWSSGGGAPTGYDVYFGNPLPGSPNSSNQAGLTYNPGLLSWGATYYWKIVPRNAAGPCTTAPTWSFSIMPDPTITSFP